MFAKMKSREEFESDAHASSLTEKKLYEGQDVKGYALTWSNTSSSDANFPEALGIFDEIKLGTFKQRIISAFLVAS